jgi:hypothetical protein
MTPERALALIVTTLSASTKDDETIALADAGPILDRLTGICVLGGDDRTKDAIAALVLAQRRMITRWLENLEQAASAIAAQSDQSDPRPAGTLGERALDSAFKRLLAAQIPSEQHREKLLMLWRRMRKQLKPIRAFVYFMAAILAFTAKADFTRWQLDTLAQAPPVDDQVAQRAAVQTILLIREVWDQRAAASVKSLLKPRRTLGVSGSA